MEDQVQEHAVSGEPPQQIDEGLPSAEFITPISNPRRGISRPQNILVLSRGNDERDAH